MVISTSERGRKRHREILLMSATFEDSEHFIGDNLHNN